MFIGKSTINKIKHDSGQSPIDAAKLNCKIYHGPYVSNFQELYDDFRINNISNLVEDHHDLSKNLIIDLKKISKKEITSPQYIKNLERDVLINTMKLINNFYTMKLIKPKFWDKKEKNFISRLLFPFSLITLLIIFFKNIYLRK